MPPISKHPMAQGNLPGVTGDASPNAEMKPRISPGRPFQASGADSPSPFSARGSTADGRCSSTPQLGSWTGSDFPRHLPSALPSILRPLQTSPQCYTDSTYTGHRVATRLPSRAGRFQADRFINRDSDGVELFRCAALGKASKVRDLLKKGVSPLQKDSNGTTAVCAAAKGMEPLPPLHVAAASAAAKQTAYQARTPVVAALAVPTPLARMAERAQIVVMLSAAGANVSAANNEGYTPLHFAARVGNLVAAEALEKRSPGLVATSAKTSKFGWTPLHSAAANGHASFVLWLKEHGADTTAQNSTDKTACELAQCECGEWVNDGRAAVVSVLAPPAPAAEEGGKKEKHGKKKEKEEVEEHADEKHHKKKHHDKKEKDEVEEHADDDKKHHKKKHHDKKEKDGEEPADDDKKHHKKKHHDKKEKEEEPDPDDKKHHKKK